MRNKQLSKKKYQTWAEKHPMEVKEKNKRNREKILQDDPNYFKRDREKQLQDDLYSFKMSYEIPKKTKKKKKKRKSISYWSDEDAISIKTNRCVLPILTQHDSAIGICIAL